MEEVLGVYARPHDPSKPVVCVDEGVKQLVGDARPPLPTRPGTPKRVDYEYTRNGTANVFMAFEPLAGVRRAEVTDRKTSKDFARFVRRVLYEWYPADERVVLVLDNLSTHAPAAFYEASAPAEARRLCDRIEWPTPPSTGRG